MAKVNGPLPAAVNSRLWPKAALVATALLSIALLWCAPETGQAGFVFTVQNLTVWPLLETRWHYALLLLFTLSFPLCASFDQRFHYFKKWKFLWPGMLCIGLIFIGWDVYFTARSVWSFNDRYLTGQRLLGLPWEEWAFFIFIPFSCVFILEALKYFVKRDVLAPADRFLTLALAGFFLLSGVLCWQQMYTGTTLLLCGYFNLYHYFFIKNQERGRFYLAYVVCLLPFFLINGALTGALTQQPVVVYNPSEFSGLRLLTVPIEDAAYGYLLLMSNFTCYAWLMKRAKRRK